eukprot:CAMPEP_0194554240 /NCGR_PEP_ID=MMETSP0253-20130528/97635_1 /TAXON_ID=2966 /ORGANISM="Noctiluca scintillans" /LENGTH=1064 /DNA_ID=CAMNT_0039401727 /DNA_START=19 /DNA_END=3213 /DNA_ORIENTATION=+
MSGPAKDVVAITTVEEVDVLIDRLESSIFKLDAAQGSAVKTMKAEVETLSNIESVSSAMKQFISRTKDRENLKAVFGGEKGKLAKARCLIDSIIGPPTKLSEKTADDRRPAECLTWCNLIQRFLHEKPFGFRTDAESQNSEGPVFGLARSSSAPWVAPSTSSTSKIPVLLGELPEVETYGKENPRVETVSGDHLILPELVEPRPREVNPQEHCGDHVAETQTVASHFPAREVLPQEQCRERGSVAEKPVHPHTQAGIAAIASAARGRHILQPFMSQEAHVPSFELPRIPRTCPPDQNPNAWMDSCGQRPEDQEGFTDQNMSMSVFDGVSSVQVEGCSLPDSSSTRDNYTSTTPSSQTFGSLGRHGRMSPSAQRASGWDGDTSRGHVTHGSDSPKDARSGPWRRSISGDDLPKRGHLDRLAGRRNGSFAMPLGHHRFCQGKTTTGQTVKDFSKMISACGKRREWAGALDLLHNMLAGSMQPDVISFNATISACGKGGQWRHALALLQELRQNGLHHNAISVNAAIGACEKVGQWEQALALLHGMQADALQPDVISYNATISACGKGNQPKRALDLLGDMWQRGCEPDVISFNAAIGACEKGGQWEQALVLLRDMRQLRRTPDVISFNTTISACGKGGQANRALMLLQEMRQHGLHPNVISFSSAISACEKGGLWERALQLLAEIRAWGLYPNVISYSAAISACEKGSQWKFALDLFSAMWRCGLEPDVICYNATISACGKGGNWLRALDLLQDMWMRRMTPNVISYSAAISACEKGGQWECAVELLWEMRQWGLQPNVISYSAAISACEKGGEWERALSLLRETRQRGLQPDIISYSAAISACEKGGQWERALELLDEMRTWGLRPNVISCSAAITACEKSGQWERALSLFQEMVRQGLQPDVVSYSVTISACEKGGQWGHTLELLQEMRNCALGNDGSSSGSPRRFTRGLDCSTSDIGPPLQIRDRPRGTTGFYQASVEMVLESARSEMTSEAGALGPHTPRQRRMVNAESPLAESDGKDEAPEDNSLVCVKNTFIDLAPQAPTLCQRKSMPTLPGPEVNLHYP